MPAKWKVCFCTECSRAYDVLVVRGRRTEVCEECRHEAKLVRDRRSYATRKLAA